MSRLDDVLKHYPVKFVPRSDQIEDFQKLIDWGRSCSFLPVGSGKTFLSTMVAFHMALEDHVDQIIVLCPPILLRQWANWFGSFKGVTVSLYRGTPKERKEINLNNDVIVMTTGILKNDFEKLMTFFRTKRVFVILDEATCIRAISSQTHRAFRDFVNTPNKMCTMLTGTELSAPWQAYGYISLATPGIYRDWSQFAAIHIKGTDQFGNPSRYSNLDLLGQNLMLHAVKREARDILELPEITYSTIEYELSKKHKKLYDAIVEELLVVLDDGEIIDGLTPNRLRVEAQRVILRPAEFGGESITPEGYTVIDNLADELANEKFIVYCNYQSTCEAVFDYCQKQGYNPVIVYGGARSSSAKNLTNVETFKNDPSVRIMVGHPRSCGVGIDQLQYATRCVLFLELPCPAGELVRQAIGRVERSGQKLKLLIRFAVAIGTIQIDLRRKALEKDDLVNRVVPTKLSLRKALLGG